MKRWLLGIWYRIMRKYAKNQIKELQNDIISIEHENKLWKSWFHIFLLLWIIEKMPKVTVVYKTNNELILKIWLNENTPVYVPISNYKGVIESIIKIRYEKEDIDSTVLDAKENLDKIHRFMLKLALDRFEK